MSNEYSREEQNALKTGLYVTLALIALSLFYVSGRKAVEHQESGSYYPVYARFGRTDGLQVGDVVRLAGMPVGKVTAAKLDDKFNAILTLELNLSSSYQAERRAESSRRQQRVDRQRRHSRIKIHRNRTGRVGRLHSGRRGIQLHSGRHGA